MDKVITTQPRAPIDTQPTMQNRYVFGSPSGDRGATSPQAPEEFLTHALHSVTSSEEVVERHHNEGT